MQKHYYIAGPILHVINYEHAILLTYNINVHYVVQIHCKLPTPTVYFRQRFAEAMISHHVSPYQRAFYCLGIPSKSYMPESPTYPSYEAITHRINIGLKDQPIPVCSIYITHPIHTCLKDQPIPVGSIYITHPIHTCLNMISLGNLAMKYPLMLSIKWNYINPFGKGY